MRIATVKVMNERFAIPLEQVQEFVLSMSYTQIEGTPKEIAGLATRRGQLVTLIDMRYCLYQKETSPLERFKVVMIESTLMSESTNDLLNPVKLGNIGILVDSVEGITEVGSSEKTPAPERFKNRSVECILEDNKEIVHLLSLASVIRAILAKGN
jgi:chemotaxis signal transduction protein